MKFKRLLSLVLAIIFTFQPVVSVFADDFDMSDANMSGATEDEVFADSGTSFDSSTFYASDGDERELVFRPEQGVIKSTTTITFSDALQVGFSGDYTAVEVADRKFTQSGDATIEGGVSVGDQTGSITDGTLSGLTGLIKADGEDEGTVEGNLELKGSITASTTTTLPEGEYAKVTNIYSINNAIKECYYKPLAEEVPNLDEVIAQQGFDNVYSGFFNLNNADSYKPQSYQSRALEILGYDCLLNSESCSYGYPTDENGNEDTTKQQQFLYKAEVISEKAVTKKTAVMNIYKALGMELVDMKAWFVPVEYSEYRSTPVVLNLPGYFKGIDTERGRTAVFVTRSNVQRYMDKAYADLGLDLTGIYGDMKLSCEDFIILVADMMHFYGEPVIPNTEVNAMLQVYGQDVPTYLSPAGINAYVYLKVRGCLNDEFMDFTGDITRAQMLDVLMCVADKDSRSTFKDIDITVDIGTDLIAEGWFPKDVTIVDGKDALAITTSYDYSKVDYYDYYIKKDKWTTFIRYDNTIDGSGIYVPAYRNNGVYAVPGQRYMGVEKDDKGVEYYHIQIPMNNEAYRNAIKDSSYGNNGTFDGYILATVSYNVRNRKMMAIPFGGGIYSVDERASAGNTLNFKRVSFTKDDTFEESVDKERRQRSIIEQQEVAKNEESRIPVLSDIADLFRPIEVYAAQGDGNEVMVKVVLDYASTITEMVERADWTVDKSKLETENKIIVTLPSEDVDDMLANVERDMSKLTNVKAYSAIATITDELMVSYDQFVENGALYSDGSTPVAVDDVLTVYSKYGEIKLNNRTKEIVVGNTLYQLADSSTVLFKESSGRLLIDFRAVYGWSVDYADINVVGNGASYSINVEDKENPGVSVQLADIAVKLPKSFYTSDGQELAAVVKKGVVNNTPCLMSLANYCLANWVIYQGVNESGEPVDACFVYYPKEALGLMDDPDAEDKLKADAEEMTRLLGYRLDSDRWVVRKFELQRDNNYDDDESNIAEAVSTKGMWQYHPTYGYIYNLPDWSEFTMEKYVNGEYILPISYSKSDNCLYNANVNTFEGCVYGERPVAGKDSEGYRSTVDIKGNNGTKSTVKDISGLKSYAAPAGIISFMGHTRVTYYPASSDIVKKSIAKSIYNVSSGVIRGTGSSFYFGTSLLNQAEVEKNGDITVTLDYVDQLQGGRADRNYTAEFVLQDSDKFYDLQEIRVSEGSHCTYITFRDAKLEELTDLSKKDNSVTVESGEVMLDWDGFDKLKTESIIAKIDAGTSFTIIFCLKIFPLIAAILLTILVGMSMMADNKVIQWVCEKTIDPVYIITFGKKHLGELDWKRSTFGLIIGYFVFTLMYNGNLIRLVQFITKAYGALVQMLGQM